MYNSIYKKVSRSCFLLMVVLLFCGYEAVYAQEPVAANTGTSGFSGVVVDLYGKPVSAVEV